MIWCVDDDATIRDIEVYALSQTGFEARGFSDGEEMFTALKEELPDLILLDVMLPGRDGVELLKELRKNPATAKIPVIMATAKGSELDKVKGLDSGADDYLVKPFGVMEMVSHVRAVLRRCAPEPENVLSFGNIKLNRRDRVVSVDGEKIGLTFKEFEILKLFMENPGMVFSRDMLLSSIWGIDFLGESRTVDMHIKTLRRKLGTAGKFVETVFGVGYKLGEGK